MPDCAAWLASVTALSVTVCAGTHRATAVDSTKLQLNTAVNASAAVPHAKALRLVWIAFMTLSSLRSTLHCAASSRLGVVFNYNTSWVSSPEVPKAEASLFRLPANPIRDAVRFQPRRVRTMDGLEDAELMTRYAAGNLQAFEELYRRHRTALYNYLVRHTRDREIANDLFQEVWARVIASRARYEPRAKFRTFLFHIGHNCFIDHCRRTAARPERTSDPDQNDGVLAGAPAPFADRPDARAEEAQTLARYRTALAELPAEQRDAFLLYEESGLSLAEIADISGVGLETAKSRVRYALAKLRRSLASHAEAPVTWPDTAKEPGL
jgi:RNA polymerase sigma-70 factor, ECF subfamily